MSCPGPRYASRALRILKFRWPWRRGPPLTIPNREVKPVRADGTATPGGRVGSRLPRKPLTLSKGLFLCDRFDNLGLPQNFIPDPLNCIWNFGIIIDSDV